MGRKPHREGYWALPMPPLFPEGMGEVAAKQTEGAAAWCFVLFPQIQPHKLTI